MRARRICWFFAIATLAAASVPVALAAEPAAAAGSCFSPAAINMPRWMPADLPLPDGTYAFRNLKKQNGYHRAKLFVPRNANGFGRFVINKWPPAGWTIGRGDSEPGEVEDSFSKSPAVGAFKDNTRCNSKKSRLYLVFNPNG